MAAPAFVLVHSPLVGAGTWTKVATLLSQQGYDAVVPRLAGAFDEGAPYYPKLVRHVVDAVRVSVPSGDLVLVGHSGAGALLPAIAQACGNVAGAIFVDALLPHPGQTWFETAPPELKAHLLALMKDEHLPRWHEWWPPGAIRKFLPDDAAYENFVGGLRELPLAYFEEAAPAGAMPRNVRCAYLQLSPACRADAEAAGGMGWPVLIRRAHHLAMLTNAADIADDLVMLSGTLGIAAA